VIELGANNLLAAGSTVRLRLMQTPARAVNRLDILFGSDSGIDGG